MKNQLFITVYLVLLLGIFSCQEDPQNAARLRGCIQPDDNTPMIKTETSEICSNTYYYDEYKRLKKNIRFFFDSETYDTLIYEYLDDDYVVERHPASNNTRYIRLNGDGLSVDYLYQNCFLTRTILSPINFGTEGFYIGDTIYNDGLNYTGSDLLYTVWGRNGYEKRTFHHDLTKKTTIGSVNHGTFHVARSSYNIPDHYITETFFESVLTSRDSSFYTYEFDAQQRITKVIHYNDEYRDTSTTTYTYY
jgi:hypothetical protein